MFDLNGYVDNDVEGNDHCHIKCKYRGSVHRGCNIHFRANYQIPVVFDEKLKNHDFHLIMQELGKFNVIRGEGRVPRVQHSKY